MINYRLNGMDYANVELLDSPFRVQRDETIELYLKTPATDDILKPAREKAGIPTDADGMPGWGPSIGQYLGSYAKLYKGTGDERLKQKCMEVFHGWVECAEKCDAILNHGTYMYEKMVGGFMDMYEFMGCDEVLPWLRKLTDRAIQNFDTTIPRDGLQDHRMKGQIEWYTLPENLYRAYQLTGEELYKNYADEWIYTEVWGKLREGNDKIGPRHAYSHVNSLSSAARAYMVSEDEKYLETIKKAYEIITTKHTFATGGYGPAETLFGEDPGYLGNSLISTWDSHYKQGEGVVYKNFAGGMVARSDPWGSCEVSCCSWAVFKICNYLMKLTGDAHYGEWAERILINGTLGQPPITKKGQALYYASYFADGAIKSYDDRRLQHLGQNFVWVCCTGTFPQDVAEYANMICYMDNGDPCISQFIPAKISFTKNDVPVILTSDADFPKEHQAHFIVEAKAKVSFALRIRVPAWANGENVVLINGQKVDVSCIPGTWMVLEREWADGDEVTIELPYRLYFKEVDPQHSNVVALMYGPLVLACDEMTVLVGDREHPEDWIKPVEGEANVFETLRGHTGRYEFITRRFRPYYSIPLMQWYYMYNRIYTDMEDLNAHHQGF